MADLEFVGIKPAPLHDQAYLFNDYWEDIGIVKSFFDANLGLTEQPTKFEFNDPNTPFSTSPRFLPPTKVEKCRTMDAIISHGCFLRECSVQHSIVGVRSHLESGVELKEGYCIIHRAGKKGKINYEWLYVGMHGCIDRKTSLFCWSFVLNTCKHVLYEEFFCSFIIDIPFLLLDCFLQPRLPSLIL
ncbi:hypothetical protein ACFX2J_039100 [Malus domestica]